jgi:hypothetical protein
MVLIFGSHSIEKIDDHYRVSDNGNEYHQLLFYAVLLLPLRSAVNHLPQYRRILKIKKLFRI